MYGKVTFLDDKDTGDPVRGETVEGRAENPRSGGVCGGAQLSFDIVLVVEEVGVAAVEID